MKATRVNTSSFAISKDVDSHIRYNADYEQKRGCKITLDGRYAPLARFKVTKREKIASGSLNFIPMKETVYSEKQNYLYVNLNSGKLVYIKGKSRDGIELGEVDSFERLIGLSSKAIGVLGHLIEYGTTVKQELDQDSLNELITLDLAEDYVYERNIFFEYLLREIGDFVGHVEGGRRELVRATVKIPRFENKSYDLSKFLHADDTIEGQYQKDWIKFAEEQVRATLNTFFRGKTELLEITYLPYFSYSRLREGSSEKKTHITACAKGGQKLEYKSPVKLRAMSLYSMDVGAKIIPIEGESIAFEDVADLKTAKTEIRRRIIVPLQKLESSGFAQEVGGGILLYGPPGCGKTYLAKAAVGEVGVSFISANLEDIMGEGSDLAPKKLHDIFEFARSSSPCVLFFDEIDAIATRREAQGTNTIVNQLLTEMDGISGIGRNILIIGATNVPWRIDPALLRSGRFTEQVYIKAPDFESRMEMFDIYLKKRGDIAPGVSARELATLTEYYSASDIKTVVDRAAVFAHEASLKAKMKKANIQQWHLIQSIKERKPSLVSWFKFAEKQMEVEGAKESYPELWADIQEFNKAYKPEAKSEEFETGTDLRKMLEDWKKEDQKRI